MPFHRVLYFLPNRSCLFLFQFITRHFIVLLWLLICFFFPPLLYLFYESGLVSQEQEILLGILFREGTRWELVADLLEVSRSKRKGILPWDREAANTGAWSSEHALPPLLEVLPLPMLDAQWGAAHGGPWGSQLSFPPPCNSSLLWMPHTDETVRNEAAKGGWKMSPSPQSSQQGREGECGAKR